MDGAGGDLGRWVWPAKLQARDRAGKTAGSVHTRCTRVSPVTSARTQIGSAVRVLGEAASPEEQGAQIERVTGGGAAVTRLLASQAALPKAGSVGSVAPQKDLDRFPRLCH